MAMKFPIVSDFCQTMPQNVKSQNYANIRELVIKSNFCIVFYCGGKILQRCFHSFRRNRDLRYPDFDFCSTFIFLRWKDISIELAILCSALKIKHKFNMLIMFKIVSKDTRIEPNELTQLLLSILGRYSEYSCSIADFEPVLSMIWECFHWDITLSEDCLTHSFPLHPFPTH